MLDRLGEACRAALRGAQVGDAFGSLLAELGVQYRVDPADLARIPATGPLAILANHPFGTLEAAVLAEVLGRVRPDVKFMANSMLAAIPEIRDRFILVSPFGGRAATLENRTPLRRSVEWLRGGGALVVFPAGEVARLSISRRAAADRPWNPAVARLIRIAGCSAGPAASAPGDGGFAARTSQQARNHGGASHRPSSSGGDSGQISQRRGRHPVPALPHRFAGQPRPARTRAAAHPDFAGHSQAGSRGGV